MTRTLGDGAFSGTAHGRDVAGVRLSEVVHPSARELPAHAHAHAYFCLLLDGVYDECSGGERLRYAPLTLAFHPAGLVHDDRIGAGGRPNRCTTLGA